MQRSAVSLRLKPPRRTRRRGVGHEAPADVSSYLSFGFYATTCMGIFLVTYLLVLACLLPMLEESNDTSHLSGDQPGGAFAGAHIPHAPGQEKIAQAAVAVKDKLAMMRGGTSSKERILLDSAKAEFESERARKRDRGTKEDLMVVGGHAGEVSPQKKDSGVASVRGAKPKKERVGFFVLGMHRSGTSMLSGLLVTGMGYRVGGPLIGAAFDNEKGFFELLPVVLQNDEFMYAQNIWWAANVIKYDAEKALEHKKNGRIKFKEGERGLEFLNDKSNSPWLQKDPRMCITMRTWLPLLETEPAVVFTYRHPLEVAMSLKKREKDFPLERGLRLWIVYNMRAVQNSADLCRVLSSNNAVLADPVNEVERIADELTSQCGVPAPPTRLTKAVVDSFVDPKLQHNKKQREEGATERRILATHGNGCVVRDFDSSFAEGTPARQRETVLYLKAMKIYCDFQSGDAYKNGYEWPTL